MVLVAASAPDNLVLNLKKMSLINDFKISNLRVYVCRGERGELVFAMLNLLCYFPFAFETPLAPEMANIKPNQNIK